MRNCANPACRAAITACMGFVKAGDVIEYEDGNRPATNIRELCGKCALKAMSLEDDKDKLQIFMQEIGYAQP